jgi:mandelate racemase
MTSIAASSSPTRSRPEAYGIVDTIRALRVRAVKVPMNEPHRTASGVITESPLVLVDLETTQGLVGHSFVFTYTAAALQPVAELVANFEALVKGQRLEPEKLSRALLARFRLLGAHGLVGMAVSAIDMAAWDALARARNVPLCVLLGADPRPTPAYGGIGYDGERESARAAEAWANRGFRGVKAKIGYPTVEEDLAVVRAIRSAVGPGVAVMVDYNQSLSVEEAKRRLARLDGEGLAWVEEPVIAEDYAGMAAVARDAATPVQAGENWWGPLEFAKAIEARATDLLMPDVMKTFGVTGWMEIARLAAPRKLPISCHLFCEVSAQLLAATPTAQWLEYADWWSPVQAHPLEIRDGMAIPSARPGSGVDWK